MNELSNIVVKCPNWTGLSILTTFFTNFPYGTVSTNAFIKKAEDYAHALEIQFGPISSTKPKIRYEDNKWDFNQCIEGANSSNLIFTFNCCGDLRESLKMFTVYNIINGMSLTTAHFYFLNTKRVLKPLFEKKKYLQLINTSDIIEIINKSEDTTIRSYLLYTAVIRYYSFLSVNYDLKFPVNIDELSVRHDLQVKLYSAHVKSSKTPSIPQYLHKIITDRCLEVLRSENCPLTDRINAGIIILISQLGLRPSEIVKIETSALRYVHISGLDNDVPFIHYFSDKESHSIFDEAWFDTYAYPYAVESFNTLIKLRKQIPGSEEIPYLYILPDYFKTAKRYPVSTQRFQREYTKLYVKYLPEIVHEPVDGISPTNACNLFKKDKMPFYIPSFTQYRVFTYSYLRNRGINPWICDINYGHQSVDLYGYYAREEDKYFRRDILAAEEFMSEVVYKKHIPIGVNGTGLAKQIESSIEESGIVVEHSNLDEIINAISGKVFIRAHNGGFGYCVKLTPTGCRFDEHSNDYLCANGLCENQYHFFWIADASYSSFLHMQKVYENDVKEGKEKRAEKTLGLIRKFLTRRLNIELPQIDEEIKNVGKGPFLLTYPNLKEIVDREDEIKKEIALWMNKKN